MSQIDLARSGDRNLVAYQRHVTLAAPGGEVAEEDGLLLFAGAHNYPGTFTNGVMRTSSAMGAPEVLDRAHAFFGPRRRGFALWVRGHADSDLEDTARAAGLWQRPPPEGNPGIAVDHPPARLSGAPDADVRAVDDDDGRHHYLAIVAAAYGMGGAPPELVEAVLFSTASLDAANVVVFLGYSRGRPVSGCMVFVADDVAGLYWAATLPEARGKGLATACFVAAWGAGFSLGARCATGMASAMGVPLWHGVGFATVTRYRRWLARPRLA